MMQVIAWLGMQYGEIIAWLLTNQLQDLDQLTTSHTIYSILDILTMLFLGSRPVVYSPLYIFHGCRKVMKSGGATFMITFN